METPKLTDSATSALLPMDRRLPLDTNTEDNVNECPPSWPTCGTDPKVSDPASASPERALPVQPGSLDR